MALNFVMRASIGVILYHQNELHNSIIYLFIVFPFLSPILIREIEKSNKVKMLNEKKLKEN